MRDLYEYILSLAFAITVIALTYYALGSMLRELVEQSLSTIGR